jgi:subtilisin family serine protease
MPPGRWATLIALCVTFGLCPIVSVAEERIVDIGHKQIRFGVEKELGYVVKSSRGKPATLLSDDTSREIAGGGAEYRNIAGRRDMLLVLDHQPLPQRERDIRLLSDQPEVEYVAPLFSLEGETVAVIPEIIVRLRQELDRGKLDDLCRQAGCTIIRNLLYTRLEFLISPAARNAEEVLTTVEVLSKADFVEWAYPNLAFQPKLCGLSATNEPNRVEPNDTYFDQQWHLNAIHAPEAWTHTTGDPNIVVAVLDDGVDIEHVDLADNIWVNPQETPGNGIDDDGNGLIDDVHGWDFVSSDADANPVSPSHGHGTACSGLIAARGDNAMGVTGVTWNCTIMAVRISPLPATDYTTLVIPADGLRYAAAQGADVISNSWILNFPYEPPHSAIQDITKLGGIGRKGKGCVVLGASGNDWQSRVAFPAAWPEVIAVGATDQNDKRWVYSSFGSALDLMAPSGCWLTPLCRPWNGLWTTDIMGPEGFGNSVDPNIEDYTNKMAGTSSACPIAAGVAALVLSIDPGLSNLQVRRILEQSAQDLGSPGFDEEYGFGRVDAEAAVTAAMNPPEATPSVAGGVTDDPGPGAPDLGDP